MAGTAVVGIRWTGVDMRGKASTGCLEKSDIIATKSFASVHTRVSDTTSYHHLALHKNPRQWPT